MHGLISGRPLAAALAPLTLVAMLLTGCQNLPGTPESQGAVAGGATGAVVGGALSNSVWGTLLGGTLGAAGGYLIGANYDQLTGGASDRDEARQAVERADQDPATAEDVDEADTADLNNDGFVTMDEVIAMENAALSNQEMLARLRATDQVFVLSPEQKEYLVEAGVSQSVVNEMDNINREERERLLDEQNAIISAPPEEQ